MGRVTGKCDFQDCVDMHSNEPDFFQKSKIYISSHDRFGNSIRIGPLKIENEIDAIPYFTHLDSGGFSKEGNTIILSEESWIDSEEFQSIEIIKDEAIHYFKRCKRKKKTPTYKDFSESFGNLSQNKINCLEFQVYNRIKVFGYNASMKGVHRAFAQARRLNFIKYAIENNADLSHQNFIDIWHKILECPYGFTDFAISNYDEFLEKVKNSVN